VGTGGEGREPARPHPTFPPIGEGVGKGGSKANREGGENVGGENVGGEAQTAPPIRVVFPAGNPALRPILAPGETGNEPIPGYEDFE